MLGYQNTKNIHDPGMFQGNTISNWIPALYGFDEIKGNFYKIHRSNVDKNYFIEGMYNGIPIRQKVTINVQ